MSSYISIISLNHFIIYIIIGYIVRDQYMIVFLCSILWEIFDTYVSHTESVKLWMQTHMYRTPEYWKEENKNKIGDLIVNMVGYHVGNLIGHNVALKV